LFQLEIWRRQATGTVAEILGEEHLERDIGTRLFMFRGNMKDEMNHYHPRGEMIISSFVQGVNAYITETTERPELLPPEFDLLGIKPGYWTPEVVVSRHQGLLGNINQELNYGRAVAALGADEVKSLAVFTPSNPDITLDSTITIEMLGKDILRLYNAFRRKIIFDSDDLKELHAGTKEITTYRDRESTGSNNWVVSGERTESGFPIMANDPHRAQAIPSLRYWVHLSAPGWDVIGGG
jgi:penicillin amidase